jgi:hypothetical protein
MNRFGFFLRVFASSGAALALAFGAACSSSTTSSSSTSSSPDSGASSCKSTSEGITWPSIADEYTCYANYTCGSDVLELSCANNDAGASNCTCKKNGAGAGSVQASDMCKTAAQGNYDGFRVRAQNGCGWQGYALPTRFAPAN